MTEKERVIPAYWFTAGDMLPHGDGRKIVLGESHIIRGKPIMCKRGLHASRHPFDALFYATGPFLYRVECSGKITEREDKLVCARRKYVAKIDATELLRLFARRQALSVIHLWAAPPVVREYLETGNPELRDAADAARATAGAAARAAAWAAADAAAWAARATAEAARAATWADADAATGDGARKMFLGMVEEAFPAQTEKEMSMKGSQTITRLYTRHYRDSGQSTTYVDWSDGSRTGWPADTASEHSSALIERAWSLGLKHEREEW